MARSHESSLPLSSPRRRGPVPGPGKALGVVAAVTLAIALVGAGGTGCRRGEPDSSGEQASSSAKRYPFHGIVRDVKNGGADVMVEHDAVPGFMGAMTMLFPARGPAQVLSALRAGDTIDATLVVEESRYWIEGILRKPGPAQPAGSEGSATAPAEPTPPGEPPPPGFVTPVPNKSVQLGEALPDFELIDQTGHRVRLSDLRGEPIAVSFLYTRCPIATACPMTTAKFSRLQAMLKEKGWGHLLILTVDPIADTQKVLADYASKAGADPKRWKFLTGSPEAVARVASSFGILYYPQRGQIIHGQGVAIIGPDGRLSSIYYGDSWQAEHVLRDLEKARHG